MNDDWDGVDWAEHFSGPDDAEIERAQEAAYQSSLHQDDDENQSSAITEPVCISNGADYENSIESAPIRRTAKRADAAYEFGFDNIEEVNIFNNFARKVGAKNLKVMRHEPLDASFIEDNGDNELVQNFKHFTVTLTAPSTLNFKFYRSSLHYHSDEKKEIVESYLRWTHIDQISARHKRTPTGISAFLQKEGFIFYPKKYVNPFDAEEKDWNLNQDGFLAAEFLIDCIEDGIIKPHLAKFLRLETTNLESHEEIFFNNLANSDKRKVICFAASSVSIKSAKILAKKSGQWSLLYFLSLQSRDVICGLEALDLNVLNLDDLMEHTRIEITSYLRFLAIEKLRIPLLNWFHFKEDRYNLNHPASRQFAEKLSDFASLYEAASPTKGFGNQIFIKLLVAVIARDFETLKLLASEGNLLAKWFCCDQAISSGQAYQYVAEWEYETHSVNVNYETFIYLLQHCLPHNLHTSIDFSQRIKSQSKLDSEERTAFRLDCEENDYQQHLDEQRYANHDYD